MKKLLSLAIVLCMLVSMLCSIPVSAANKLDSLNDYAMDFENGASLTQYVSATGWTPADEVGVTIGQSSMQLVADPDDASNTVMKVSLGTTEKEFGLTLRSITGAGNGASYATGSIPAGSRIVYTFRYRFAQKMNASNGVYNGATYYPEFCINNTGANFAKSTTLLATAENQWHTAVLTYTNTTENTQSITQAQLRFCGANDGNGKYQYKMLVAEGHTGYDAATGNIDLGERIVYIDDVTAVVETAPVDKIESLSDYSMGFESGKSSILTYASYPANGWATADATVRSNNNFAMQLVKDPVNSKNNVLKLNLNATVYSGPIFNSSTAQNAAAYATGTIPADSRIVYTFRYYLETEMDASNKPQFSIDISGGKYATATAFETASGKWHAAKLIYTNNTGADVSITQANLRFQGTNSTTLWKALNSGERVIYFDDFTAVIEKTPAADKIASLADYSMSFEHGNSSILTYASYPTSGWVTADSIERANDNFAMQLIKDPINSKNTVLKLAQKSGKYSGPIFGNATAVASNDGTAKALGTVPAGSRIVFTFLYYVDSSVSTANPKFSIDIGGGRFATTTAFDKTEGKWNEAKLIYSNNTGADVSITQANIKFQDSYDSSTLWAASEGDCVFYFDDFAVTVEKTPAADKIASLADYSMSFEHGNSSILTYSTSPSKGYVTADLVERADSNFAMQLVKDPANSENTVLKLTFADASKYNGPIFAATTAMGNSTCATGTIPAYGKITYTFRYYLGTEMDSTNNPQFSIANGYKDETGASKSAFATAAAFETTAGEWHEVTLVYTNDTGADIAITEAKIRTQGGYDSTTNWKAADGGKRVIYFDDFTAVIEEGTAPSVTETAIEKVEGGIKVSALDAITDAKLIFVTYDANGRMIATNLDTAVTLSAQGTQVYTIPSGFENAKVMLWKDLSTLIPLAASIN